MTTSTHIGILLLCALGAVACGSEDEAPAESAERETGRAELLRAEAGYFTIVRNDGGALYAARVGATDTLCADGSLRASCPVAVLDLERADLQPADEQSARARLEDGKAIVLAKLVPSAGESGARLVGSEVWTRGAAAPTLANARAQTDGMFVLGDVREACDPSCGTCAWLRAEPIGGGSAAAYTRLEVGALGGPLDAREQRALAKGKLLASGAAVGTSFVVAAVYAPFGRDAGGPGPSTDLR